MTLFLAVNLLAPNAGLAFWMALVFLTLLLLLSKFAWGPMIAGLAEREQNIDQALRESERARAEAQQLLADNEKVRREAEAEATRILREAREAAEASRNEAIEREREQVARLREQFQEEMAREKEQIKQELRTEVAALAVQAAEKILRAEVDQQQQQRLVNDFLAELPKN